MLTNQKNLSKILQFTIQPLCMCVQLFYNVIIGFEIQETLKVLLFLCFSHKQERKKFRKFFRKKRWSNGIEPRFLDGKSNSVLKKLPRKFQEHSGVSKIVGNMLIALKNVEKVLKFNKHIRKTH